MRYGYWLPIFGGWLRNVPDEGMEASWDYVRRLACRSERIGYDLTLVAELNLNDIKGTAAPSLDAWSTAAALAAVTERLELMVAVRPTFHSPALLAKQAANIDHICGTPGRLSLNVVSSWWADEARQYGVHFEQHEDRYARTAEWLDVVDGLWTQDRFSYAGKILPRGEHDHGAETAQPPPPFPVRRRGKRSRQGTHCAALRCLRHARRPARAKRPRKDRRSVGASRAARNCPRCSSAWRPTRSSATPNARRRRNSRVLPTCNATAAGFANYQQWLSGTQLEQRMTIEEYSVSNRGLRPGLVGTPAQVAERVAEFEEAGVNLLLLQCSPQAEEMERFAAEVIQPLRKN